MTEKEAYDALGWPHVGSRGWFVLPLSGSDRTDWITYQCLNGCGYKGLTVPEAFEPLCLKCGAQNLPNFCR